MRYISWLDLNCSNVIIIAVIYINQMVVKWLYRTSGANSLCRLLVQSKNWGVLMSDDPISRFKGSPSPSCHMFNVDKVDFLVRT